MLSSYRYNGSLVIWKVVCLTASKFKPLVFPVWGFSLSNVANISIVMILVWLLLADRFLCSGRLYTGSSRSYLSTNSSRARVQCDHIFAEDSFLLWEERTSPYSEQIRGADASVRCWQLISMLVWHVTSLLTSTPCFSFTFPPSRRLVPSHTNRPIATVIEWLLYLSNKRNDRESHLLSLILKI
jgi:hypothetical protein